MLSDFSGTFHRDALEKNYSLHHDTLVAVLEFLNSATAPVRLA
jgi:hypothetical protein